jgi:hypothetical protein
MKKWLGSAQVLRWVGFIGYGILLLIGTLLITIVWPRAVPPGRFVATKTLAANRLLQPGDFTVVSGVGEPWYLKHEVEEGKAFGLGDIVTVPTMTSKPGRLPIAFPIAAAQVRSGAINAGSKGHICHGGKELAGQVEIAAVLCSAAESCVAIANVPADKAAALAAASPAAVLQTAQTACVNGDGH